MTTSIEIRPYQDCHKENLWTIFKSVSLLGEAFMQDESCTIDEWKAAWFSSKSKIFTAYKGESIVGGYVLKPNNPGRGGHVANSSYMVSASARGQHIGKLLGEHSLLTALECGYSAIQFNAVVSTNDSAIALWKSLGFRIVGKNPEAFKHAQFGLVDTFVMYKEISRKKT